MMKEKVGNDMGKKIKKHNSSEQGTCRGEEKHGRKKGLKGTNLNKNSWGFLEEKNNRGETRPVPEGPGK